jgi:coenzyme F420-reducing hydrogenase beta subunit
MNHLCIGCGICAAFCPHERIQMVFSAINGYYIPSTSFEECEIACGLCERVRLFVPENPSTVDLTKHLLPWRLYRMARPSRSALPKRVTCIHQDEG